MAEALPFWQSISLEDLAEQQGVSAVNDLDEISALWPAEDDPVEFLQYLSTERAKRRKLGKNKEKTGRR